MATEFGAIYDSFMQRVTDYRLTILYNASVSDFETYLNSWLLDAIEEFQSLCDQSLAYASESFTETLTQRNIRILSLLMTKYWLKKNIDDIRQMNLHVMDKDFKVYSESQNMREKQQKYNVLREELSQELMDYSLNNADRWALWITNGTFYDP